MIRTPSYNEGYASPGSDWWPYVKHPEAWRDCIAAYPFFLGSTGADALDLSGYGERGTWGGSSNHWTTVDGYRSGNFLRANDDLINCGASPFYRESSTVISIEVWIYCDPADFNTSVHVILDTASGNEDANNGFFMVLEDRDSGTTNAAGASTFKLAIANTAGAGYREGRMPDNSIDSARIFHVVAQYSPSDVELFLDGVSQTVSYNTLGTGTGDYVPRNANLHFGETNTGGANLTANILEAKLFNSIRTPAEVRALYDIGVGGSYQITEPVSLAPAAAAAAVSPHLTLLGVG